MQEKSWIPRLLEETVRERLEEFPVVMIQGPRQAGKTALVKRFVDETRRYISLDDKSIQNRIDVVGSDFVSELGNTTVIDEIQEWPHITNAIKQEVDERPGNGRFLLTGAPYIRTLREKNDSLAGRACFLTLLPLSQAEIKGVTSQLATEILFGDRSGKLDLPSSIDGLIQNMVTGGYPQLLGRSAANQRTSWLRNYCEATSNRDIPLVSKLKAKFELGNLLRILAKNSASRLSVDQVRAEIGLSHHTTNKIIGILADLGIIHLLDNYQPEKSLFSSKQQRKLHFTDTGVLSTLLKISEASLARSPFPLKTQSMLFETFIYSEIAKLCDVMDDGTTIGYWNDGRAEVNLVITYQGTITGVEITREEFIKARRFDNLKKLAEQAENMRRGIVIYAGDNCLGFHHPTSDGREVQMFALPASALWASDPDRQLGLSQK